MDIFTIIVIVLYSIRMSSLGTKIFGSNLISPSPCVEDRDSVYDGVRVNCQHKGISSLPLPANWIPIETSSLLLDYNSLVHLNKTSFSTFQTWKRLRLLGLSHNSISYIEPFTFSKFVSLRQLDLEYNLINLDRKSLSGHEFDGLISLSDLKLEYNNNGVREGAYPMFLLSKLYNLQSLGLDTFVGDLNFSKRFHVPKRLSSLFLSGGMTGIKNDSFEAFSSTNTTKLYIRYSRYLQHSETGSFLHLEHNLQSLDLVYVGLGLRDTLESLAPFVSKNMSDLNFSNLFYDLTHTTSFAVGRVLTAHIARYLSQICVENFALTMSGIFVIESIALTSPTWKKCLKTLDLSQNPIMGEKSLKYGLLSLHRLEVIRIMDVKYYLRPLGFENAMWHPPNCPCIVKDCFTFGELKPVQRTGAQSFGFKDNNESQSRSEIKNTFLTINPVNSALSPRPDVNATNRREVKRTFQQLFYLPKRLRILVLNSFADYFIRLDEHAHFMNGDILEELHLSNNGVRNFTGSYSGLTNLKLLDLSRNDGYFMSPTFYNIGGSLVHLNMAEMNLDFTFMDSRSSELFSPLPHLSTLNLSLNDLQSLSKDTFKANPKLRVLILAGNRFESIPFDLSHVRDLCWLDLTGNALQELSELERTKLDRHSDNVKAFTLSLNGNPIHCGCQSIRFLSWLRRTHINLDKQGNYPCTLDSGRKTKTGNIHDLDAIWRKCNGETSFFMSLVLCCFTISSFFFFTIILKFKTQLKAFLLKKFWPTFMLKSPVDYAIGVYIGYSDQDMNLACHRIRHFIEEELGLSTYVRHRDLLPASDVAEAIVEAVHSSWRVLFLVSHHFLADPWSYFALKTSTYAVQLENPGRIVLILMDGDNDNEPLLPQLPPCVLRAVQEQSIVTMTSRGQISYEDKQALVTALLYQGYFFED